jgi:C4-dicarboxylate-specific signal transduction histidine kinase
LNIINNSKSAGAKKLTVSLMMINQSEVAIVFNDEGAGETHKTPDGLGIGLKLSGRIIAAMGGKLIFSAQENGAQTVVRIPIFYPEKA